MITITVPQKHLHHEIVKTLELKSHRPCQIRSPQQIQVGNDFYYSDRLVEQILTKKNHNGEKPMIFRFVESTRSVELVSSLGHPQHFS